MEWFDIVDENGEPEGEIVSREAAHFFGIRHRTSHVWVLRQWEGRVQVLLQKRSEVKDSFPGCYDISSAGHIPAGQGYMESALRELEEELGLVATEKELIDLGLYSHVFERTFHGRRFQDNQVSRVYVLWRDVAAKSLQLQTSEVSSVRWMDLDECLDQVKAETFPHCIQWPELLRVAEYVRTVV